jgi:hypothetical protein
MNKISSTIAQAMNAATFQNRNALSAAVAGDRTEESLNIRIERFEEGYITLGSKSSICARETSVATGAKSSAE